MAEAIYTTSISSGTEFCCRIPKKRGNGFSTSVFGFHSTNAAARKWDDIKPEIAGHDYCDIDGYLSIDIRLHWWEAGYKEGIEEVKNALSQVFPHITSWRDVGHEAFFKGLQTKEV